ncbi:hypothetical protein [Candidatus Chlamydia corallus]|uniref:hypothetical protein n=1 Tax=Candidatus Chlamydia corallus TaxID=2038470 RepID=UPI000C2FDE60|nr:hypothetical protein [Candidatus Chlamydia corallus]
MCCERHKVGSSEFRKVERETCEIGVCNKITSEQNFDFSLDVAIRQSVSRFRIPERLSIERRALGEKFFQNLTFYLKTQGINAKGGQETHQYYKLSVACTE